MAVQVPVYRLQAFPRHEPNTPFYMTPLEKLVAEFNGIDQPHAHTFYLLMWIYAGSGTHTIDFRTYAIGPYQLYFLTPGQVHSWELSPDVRGFNLFFDPQFFQGRYQGRLFQDPFFHSHQHQPLLDLTDQGAEFSQLFDLTFAEYSRQEANRADVFLSYVHILLEKANRRYEQQRPTADTYLYDRIRQYEELLEKSFLIMRRVSDYAAQMNVTPNYLNHICQRVLGKTASQLWAERLLIEAQRLLTHTAESVKEIGFALGFADTSYFVRFFRKQSGRTPADFRREVAGYR